MLDISFGEISLLILIGLVVLGPDKLPGVIRSTVKTIQQLRSMALGVKTDIEKELKLDELSASIKNSIKDNAELTSLTELKQEISTLASDVKFDAQKHFASLESELKKSINNEPSELGVNYFDKLAQPIEEPGLLNPNFNQKINTYPTIANSQTRFFKLVQERQTELALQNNPLALFVLELKAKQAQADILSEHEWMQFYIERLQELNGDIIDDTDEDNKSNDL